MPRPWTGWSICDPGNNYHFSFLRATMLWALATQNTALARLPADAEVRAADGLLRGAARRRLARGHRLRHRAEEPVRELHLLEGVDRRRSRRPDTPHTRETIDYWVHATVPTRDRFAPIGDQSRSSIPELYDFHENLVHTAVVLSGGHAAGARAAPGGCRTTRSTASRTASTSPAICCRIRIRPLAPTDLTYHATGAGALFARSSWDTDAAWLSFIAGKYDQSHAHQDQGAFTFFKGDWLAVTQQHLVAQRHPPGGRRPQRDPLRARRRQRDSRRTRATPSQSSMTPSASGGRDDRGRRI